MNVVALGYLGLESNKLSEWKEFGNDVLGLSLRDHTADDAAVYFSMDEYLYRLAVHPGEKEGLAYIGFEVEDKSALAQVHERLTLAGLRSSPGSEADCRARGVRGLVRCEDPAGNAIELYYGMKRVCMPFNSPTGISGFVTGALGMGHVVIEVPDLEACEAFYTEMLGLRVSDYFSDKLVFLRCNARHHSVALASIGGLPGLRHLLLEVEKLDEVGMVYDLCARKGVPIARTLGKHSNDWMYSFYALSPSGFELEYGSGGRLVDDTSWTVCVVDRPSIWGHKPVGESAMRRQKRLEA
ncbi:MAG: VOC family protein [Aquisalimonadaceae bacterium]